MKRILYALMSLVLITALITGCGGGSAPSGGAGGSGTATQSANIGAFSVVGGWKTEKGAVYILKEDGSGLLVSEPQGFEGNLEDYGIAPIYKSNISWKEDSETATITRAGQEYIFQKKSDNGQEILQIEDGVFSRISETEIKEYETKAENAADLDALPTMAEKGTADSKEYKKIEFSDTILLDNDLVTVELVQFYEKEYNWGSGTQIEKCITLKVHNNSEKDTHFNLNDGYVNDESVLVIMEDGNVGPAPGKTKTYSYCIQYNTSPDPTPLESLEDLYTFDAEIDTYASEKNTISDRTTTRFCINDVIQDASLAAAAGETREAHPDVYAAISDGMWVFNGGDDLTLSYIRFGENKAKVGQVFFDGNGRHDKGTQDCEYSITDESIVVSGSGEDLVIPYSISEGDITLGSGEYYTLEEVDEGIQGYWRYTTSFFGKGEGYLLVDHGTLESEKAHTSSGGAPGEYSYFHPDEASYTLGIGYFETEMFNGNDWFYNIIDGEPVVLYFDNICTPADGFPGENGYSF